MRTATDTQVVIPAKTGIQAVVQMPAAGENTTPSVRGYAASPPPLRGGELPVKATKIAGPKKDERGSRRDIFRHNPDRQKALRKQPEQNPDSQRRNQDGAKHPRDAKKRPTGGQPKNERKSPGETPPDLAAVVDAWPALPPVIRAGIVAMVAAAVKDEVPH